jgi:hypothetical protein
LQSSCVLVRHFLLVAPVVEVVVNCYFSADDQFSKWFQSSSFPLDLALSGSGFWVNVVRSPPFPWYILESFLPPVALLPVGFRSLKIRFVAHAVSWLGCLELVSW